MASAGKHGVTKNTPENITLGAGTIHKNLKYSESWNFDESIIGATKGGNSLTITPEFYEIEPDGALVSVKGLTVKIGETASLKIKFLELNKELIKYAVAGEDGVSTDETYDVIKSKAQIADGDYLENIAFVGQTISGKNIIVILNNALCVSGFNLDGENKKEGVVEYEFKCHANIESDLDKLPYEIYYPKSA